MKQFDLSLLSKYRTELMGISALMILVCHAPGNGIGMPKYLEYALVQGQIGVDIFLFLSGMGLWYSLSKISYWEVECWYLNRYVKILVPYIIIQGALTAIRCIMDDSLGILFWLSNVSTIEFWLTHRAAWFIALLLPLYLIAPLLFRFLKTNATVKTIGLLVLTYIIALFPLKMIGQENDYCNVFYNIQFVMIRVPSFILGMYMAPYIKANATIKSAWIIPMLIGAMAMFVLTKKPIDTYMFLVLPVMLFWITLFRIKEEGKFNSICRFFGGISLESYLWNGLGIAIIPLMALLRIPDYNNLVMYSLVLIVGTILSVTVSRISQPIIKFLTRNLSHQK